MNKNFYTKSSTKPYLIYNKKFKIEEDEIFIIKADLNLLIKEKKESYSMA